MFTMKIGAVARLIQPVIQGHVAAKRLNVEADEIEYQIVYRDAAGDVHHRWFLASQLEPVASADAADAAAAAAA